MPDAPSLAAGQAWLQRAIVRADVPCRLGVGDTVLAPSSRLSAADRLAIHQRGYHGRLLECLRAMHPALCHALGAELFDGFALDYLGSSPPTGRLLASLDEGWVAHLEATRPDAASDRDERESWPDFLVDLARLERAFNDVFDGPGAEGKPLLTAADVGAGVRLVAVPGLRLLATRYPVGPYLSAVRRGERPALPGPAAGFLALCRRDWVVTLTELSPAQHAVLAAVLEGGGRVDRQVSTATLTWLRAFAAQGFFRAEPTDR
jgi:hypothetical protein